MLYIVLRVLGVYLMGVGVVACVLLFSFSRRVPTGIRLVTALGIGVLAFLTVDFACRLFHLPRHIVPHQVQISKGIDWALQMAAIPLVLARLYEWWTKKRKRDVPRPPSVCGENNNRK